MKRMQIFIRVCAGFLVVMTLLTACGGLKSRLVGIWSDGQSSLEFRSDGTLDLRMPFGSSGGIWKTIDNSHINMQFDGLIASFSNGNYQVTLEGDILTLTGPQGSLVMRRY